MSRIFIFVVSVFVCIALMSVSEAKKAKVSKHGWILVGEYKKSKKPKPTKTPKPPKATVTPYVGTSTMTNTTTPTASPTVTPTALPN